MVGNEVVDGGADDFADFHAVVLGNLCKRIAEIIAYGTHTVERVVLVIRVVPHNVGEERLETLQHNLAAVADVVCGS